MARHKGHVWQHYPTAAYRNRANRKKLKKLLESEDLSIMNIEAQQALVDCAMLIYEMGEGRGNTGNFIYQANPL